MIHNQQPEQSDASLRSRRTTLPDNRYLLYFTFDEEPAPSDLEQPASLAEPDPMPEATEERRV